MAGSKKGRILECIPATDWMAQFVKEPGGRRYRRLVAWAFVDDMSASVAERHHLEGLVVGDDGRVVLASTVGTLRGYAHSKDLAFKDAFDDEAAT